MLFQVCITYSSMGIKNFFEECSGYDLRASKLWPFFIFKWTVPSLSRINLSVLAVLMIHTNFIISPGVFWSHAWNQSQKNGRWQREEWKKEEEKFGKENSRKMLHFITTGSQYNTTIFSLPFHCFQKKLHQVSSLSRQKCWKLSP